MKRSALTIVLFAFAIAFGAYAQEKPLTLEECVDIALEQNPDIVRGEFTVKIAGKDVTVAMSRFLPYIDGRMSYYNSTVGPSSQLRIDPQTGILVPVQPFEVKSYSYTASLSANQTLFDGGYSIYNYLQKRSMKKSADYNFEDTKQMTILIVKERYYNLLAAEKLLEVAEETLRSSEESYKRAEALYEVGKAPKSDVLQAKVQLETDRLGVIQAQNSLAIALASMNHILGFDVDKDIQVVDNLDLPEVEITYANAMDNAFANHPLLHRRMFDVKAAKDGIFMALSSFLPSFNFYYGYDWRHRDFGRIKEIFDTDYSWYYMFRLSIPVFQGWSRVANTGRARLDYLSTQEALEQGKRDVALEVKQAYFDVQQAKKSIAVSQNAVEAAEEGLRLNREKYSLGAGTMLDLIVAQVSYTSSQSDFIQAKYDYKYAVARLERAMGQLKE